MLKTILLIGTLTCACSTSSFAKCVIASHYHQGKKTANGERFNPDGHTAAHRNLPFGTIVHVTNPRNGKSASVRINDRGPFIKGRELDLSRGAARTIGFSGVGRVCIS